MKVLHISTECYPAAKAGGMGDVVGALPKYLPEHGVSSSVIIPKYANDWIKNRKWKKVYNDALILGDEKISFTVECLDGEDLGFPLYVISIPGKFDRAQIYLAENGAAFPDEIQRNLCFQIAILTWLQSKTISFDLLHCHDHMTGLIPFMMQHAKPFEDLKMMPTFFTIHNGQYRGIFDWRYKNLLPSYNKACDTLLDWDGNIHSLAAAMKCAWNINTVSPSYMKELQNDFDNLTTLAQAEKEKSIGILNGIDTQLWNPTTDPMIKHPLKKSIDVFKNKNKQHLAKEYQFKTQAPLVSFIGRFAFEKGADLLSPAYDSYLSKNPNLHLFILGSGDKAIEKQVTALAKKWPQNVTSVVAYDEALAHQIYAASDYLIMPSRFEPCGLNQLYAMRYATIPIARTTGGLIDTVPDIGDAGNGINFWQANQEDIVYSLGRAFDYFQNKKAFENQRIKISQLDYSWNSSAALYAKAYFKTFNKNT